MAPSDVLRPSRFPRAIDAGDQIIFSSRDLEFELTVTKAILRSLDVDQILYVMLSGITAGEGLGFNRGLFLLADEGQRALRVSMAIGPVDKSDAHRIWEEMRAKDLTLGSLLSEYDTEKSDPNAHHLTRSLAELSLPLDRLEALAQDCPLPVTTGEGPLEPMLANCLLSKIPQHSSSLVLTWKRPGSHSEVLRLRNWSMIPLLTPERVVGMLIADDAFTDRVVSPADRHLLLALANLAAIAVEKGKLFSEMRRLAEVDGLTGLANRRVYDQELQRLLAEARRTGRPVSLVVFDVDHFKRYNDRFGHLAGDDALRFVGEVLRRNARRTDLIARYGGEEFAVILPDTPADQAMQVAQKLIDAIRTSHDEVRVPGRVTASAGVACCEAGQLSATELFSAADRAVYEAKRNGRDRVESADGERPH